MTTNTETLEGFLNSRVGWLRIEAVDRPTGGWDVALRIDGTYFGNRHNKQEIVDYYRERLLPLLLNAGITQLEDWNRPVKSETRP
jgi:hypothetical protein